MSVFEHDKLFLRIIKEEKHVALFLDAVFGFLYRCTDFYKTHNDLNEDSEIAKELLLQTFQKWKKQAQEDHEYSRIKRLASDGVAPHAVTEVDVTSESPIVCPNSLADIGTSETRKTLSIEAASNQDVNNADSGYDSKTQQASDCYNGAVRDGYRWSQSITDLDVQVVVPCNIKKGKNVRVDVKASNLSVAVLDSGQWSTLLAGELSWKVNKEESVWTLVPGNEINIHLEKSQERWWDSLLVSEPKIDLKHIDACRPMDDLPQEEQMKIQELMWNEERKRLGLPTSEQLATEKILKEAWNKDGSPFKNLDYDPTLVNFGNS